MASCSSTMNAMTGLAKIATLSTIFQGPDITRYRALFNATRAGDVAQVTALLAEGLAVNCVGPRGATPLHIAARFGQLAMVQLLLANGGDARLRDDRGQTPAAKAQSVGEAAVVAQLALAEPPTSTNVLANCRRLFEAAHTGATDELMALLAAQPSLVHVVGPRGATVLHVAARYGHTSAVGLLLESGSSAAARDHAGQTGADKALQFGHTATAALLFASSDSVAVQGPREEVVDDTNVALHASQVLPVAGRAARPTGAAILAKSVPGSTRVAGSVVDTKAEAAAKVALEAAAVVAAMDAETRGPREVALWRSHVTDIEAQLIDAAYPREESMSFALVGVSGAAVSSYASLAEATANAPVTIGRARACTVQLQDAEVSGQHAQVWCDQGIVYAADRPGSFNGTFLRLAAEKEQSEPYHLQLGDSISIGSHTLMLEPSSSHEIGGEAGDPEFELVVRNLKEEASRAMHLQIPPEGLTVGRAKSSGISLSDPLVSGCHAELRLTEGGWCVRDLGSSNGTVVRLASERRASRPFSLTPGQSIVVGSGPTASEFRLCRVLAVVAERKGRRPTMEDAHVIIQRLPPPPGLTEVASWPPMSFCAVYDGHGGAEASDFARRELHRLLLHHVGPSEPTLHVLCTALHAAFLSTDANFLQTTQFMSGSTAVAALLTPTHLLVANAGDSRAALCRNGRVMALSVDHKPERRDEHGRILAAGGFVANNRIMHSLAVSRALGDREYKLTDTSDEQGLPFTASLVVAEPEVRVCRATAGDEVLLACDGLWDVFSAEAAFDFLHKHDAANSPQQAVQSLARAAEEEFHSNDNITVIYLRV